MKEYREEFIALVEMYSAVESNKHRVESLAALSMVNVKYLENLRHSYSHIMSALKGIAEHPDEYENNKQQILHAQKHLSDLDVNGYEYLAGHLLKKLREKIERSGFQVKIGKAKGFFDEAQDKFAYGRDNRTENKSLAMNSFENCIRLCIDGLREIGPIEVVEKRRVWLQILAIAISCTALIVSLSKCSFFSSREATVQKTAILSER